jgi:hypothetical protein
MLSPPAYLHTFSSSCLTLLLIHMLVIFFTSGKLFGLFNIGQSGLAGNKKCTQKGESLKHHHPLHPQDFFLWSHIHKTDWIWKVVSKYKFTEPILSVLLRLMW